MSAVIKPILDGKEIHNVDSIQCENGKFALSLLGEHTLSLILSKPDEEDGLLTVTVENVRLDMDMTVETKEFLRMKAWKK